MTSDVTNVEEDALLPKRLYLDTQFVFAYLVDTDLDHADALRTARELRIVNRAGLTTAFLSMLVLNELAWQLAATFFDAEHGEGAWYRSDRQRAHESVRKEVAETIDSLLREQWLHIASADEESCSKYASFMRHFPLRPADLAHLVIADSSGMDAILTHDSDFHALEDSPVRILSYRRSE